MVKNLLRIVNHDGQISLAHLEVSEAMRVALNHALF